MFCTKKMQNVRHLDKERVCCLDVLFIVVKLCYIFHQVPHVKVCVCVGGWVGERKKRDELWCAVLIFCLSSSSQLSV